MSVDTKLKIAGLILGAGIVFCWLLGWRLS
jgi:hypothetical protein